MNVHNELLAELREENVTVIASHDGYVFQDEDGDRIYDWDVEFDGSPWRLIDTLLTALGVDIEEM